MKSMQPPPAAIFFMTDFHRAGGGGHGPVGPPGSATAVFVAGFVCYCHMLPLLAIVSKTEIKIKNNSLQINWFVYMV